eukprot:406183-Alexandrium_andersonii.AAC.1
MSIENRLAQSCIWRSPALSTLSCGPKNEHRESFRTVLHLAVARSWHARLRPGERASRIV